MAQAAVDSETAAAAGVAVPPKSKDEYLQAIRDTPTNLGSSDQRDPSVGWTVQSGAPLVDGLDETPGQVYMPHQLPDPNLAVANGLPIVRVPEHLITEDETHPQGPEPSELVTKDLRAGIAGVVAENQVAAVQAAQDAQAANVSDDAIPVTDPAGSTVPGQSQGGGETPAE